MKFDETIQIKRYPNRRLYARQTSKYVTLQDIEELVRDDNTVEIRDSQSGEDVTRQILTQIILERQPEKMGLFPSAMLHFILRANDLTADFLRAYFRDSLTYLEHLQRNGSAKTLAQPMLWMKSWLSRLTPPTAFDEGTPPQSPDELVPAEDARELAKRVEELERRLRQLESAPDAARE